MIEEEKNQFAVLIDADNISPKYAPIIFQELEAYGFPSCRRIYGNWSKANGWNEELLLEYSIIPVQQFSYTSGSDSFILRSWILRRNGWWLFSRLHRIWEKMVQENLH